MQDQELIIEDLMKAWIVYIYIYSIKMRFLRGLQKIYYWSRC